MYKSEEKRTDREMSIRLANPKRRRTRSFFQLRIDCSRTNTHRRALLLHSYSTVCLLIFDIKIRHYIYGKSVERIGWVVGQFLAQFVTKRTFSRFLFRYLSGFLLFHISHWEDFLSFLSLDDCCWLHNNLGVSLYLSWCWPTIQYPSRGFITAVSVKSTKKLAIILASPEIVEREREIEVKEEPKSTLKLKERTNGRIGWRNKRKPNKPRRVVSKEPTAI